MARPRRNPPDRDFTVLLGQGMFSKAYARPGEDTSAAVDAVQVVTTPLVGGVYREGTAEIADVSKSVIALARTALQHDPAALAYLPQVRPLRVDRNPDTGALELVYTMARYGKLDARKNTLGPVDDHVYDALTTADGSTLDRWAADTQKWIRRRLRPNDLLRRPAPPVAFSRQVWTEGKALARAMHALHAVATSLPLTHYASDHYLDNLAIDPNNHLILLDPMVAEMRSEDALRLWREHGWDRSSMALRNARVLTGDVAPDGTIGRMVKGPDGKRRRIREHLTPAELAAPDWRRLRVAAPPALAPATPAPLPEPEPMPAPPAAALRTFDPGSVPMDLAVRAHAGTSFVPERRGEQVVSGYRSFLADMWARVQAKCKTPEEEAIALEAMERFKQRYRSAFTARLGAQSRIVSSMIAGPSRFPVRQMEKRNATEGKRLQELVDVQEGGEAWVWKHVQDYRKAQELEHAGSKGNLYRQKAERLQKLQALMVAANKIVRAKATAEAKIARMGELGLSPARAAELLKPDFAGRYGFADYQLTNNGAEIRRLLKQAEAEDAKDARPTADVLQTDDGIRVVDNAEADRVQIVFPGKPDDATRTALKARGFRWSPTEGAWQRQRTNAALYWAQQLVQGLSGAKANGRRRGR